MFISSNYLNTSVIQCPYHNCTYIKTSSLFNFIEGGRLIRRLLYGPCPFRGEIDQKTLIYTMAV